MQSLTLYYDGECPICKRYTMFLKLKKDYHLILKDARESIELEDICTLNQIDINDGMILITETNEILQGGWALLYLKKISNNKNLFYRIFISKSMIRITYPILKNIRLLLLKILRKKLKIDIHANDLAN